MPTSLTKNIFSYFSKGLAVLFLIAGLATLANAQQKDVNYTNQQWFQYYNQLKINEKFTVLTDGGFRLRNNFSESSQYLLRASISYSLGPDVKVAAGYANFGGYLEGNVVIRENRAYQDITFSQKFTKLSLNQRVRVEERFFKTTQKSNIPGEKETRFRFRYGIQLTIPLFNLSPNNTDRKMLFQVGDEIFINAGKDIVYNIFDQNRVLIGPVFQFDKNLSISLIYNHQYRAINQPSRYAQDYVFWLGIRQKMDFSK